MRAFLLSIVAVLALGSPVMADDPNCMDEAKVIVWAHSFKPDATHVVYRGGDADGIEAGLSRASVVPLTEAVREFMVFRDAKTMNLLVVGMIGGCAEAYREVAPQELDAWLAGISG